MYGGIQARRTTVRSSAFVGSASATVEEEFRRSFEWRFSWAEPRVLHSVGCALPPIHGPERVLEDICANLPAQMGPRFLVKAEVDATIDACVIDVVGYLFP